MSAAIANALETRIVCEPVTEDDLEAVLAIERRLYPYPWTYGNFRDSIRSGYQCVLYRVDGDLAAYAVATIAAGEAHLLNLSIAQHYQRRGHGRRLLEHIIGLARLHYVRLMYLEVRPSNVAARRLYAERGFARVGVRRDYYPGATGREDALVLSLDL